MNELRLESDNSLSFVAAELDDPNMGILGRNPSMEDPKDGAGSCSMFGLFAFVGGMIIGFVDAKIIILLFCSVPRDFKLNC